MMYAQIPTGDTLLQVFWFVFFIGMFFFYPRLLLSQTIWKMEKDLADLEKMTSESVRALARKMKKDSDSKTVAEITAFLDFFAQPPVDIDPRGIMAKLGKTIKEQFDSFTVFVEEHADAKGVVERRNLEAALINTTGGHQIAKVVRHYLEIVKKYKNLQIAIIIQMQMPMIRDIAEAVSKSVKSLLEGEPVGDGIGPLVVAEMIGPSHYKHFKNTQMVYAVKKMDGRRVVFVKADGPGAAIGYPGEALVPLIKRYRPSRLLTVDAAQKMEGETTGAVAEGVGVVMGPIGIVQRFEIEEIATRMNIPIDALIIKMKAEESMYTMSKEVYESVPTVTALAKRKLQRLPRGRTLMVLGVGNTVGVGNNKKELRETETLLKKGFKKLAKEEAERKKEKRFWEK
ncbi:MAG: DUF1512 family protein [Candidatus Aenigmatarchaeota archaeon]|nr:MAG: DUF1512 family protein [Candidatus Aenigmarchaeota archaeon]